MIVLLITSIVGAAVFVTAEVTRTSLEGAGGYDRAVQARSYAESGIEDALYHLREEAGSLPDGHDNLKYPNGAVAARTVQQGDSSYETTLPAGNALEFSIYNPAGPDIGGGVEALRIYWVDVCGGVGTELDVRFTNWKLGDVINWDAPNGITKYLFSAFETPAAISDFRNGTAYRVRITSTGCAIQLMTVEAFGDDALTTPNNSMQIRTIVRSVGSARGRSWTMEAITLPADLLPVSD